MFASAVSLLVLLGGLALQAALPHAAAAPEPSPYKVSVDDVTIAPGETGSIRVTLAVPPGFHTYRDWVDVTVTDAGGLTIRPASVPPGVMLDDPGAPGKKRETYEDDVLVDLPVIAPAVEGKHSVVIHAHYQGCKKSLCYMPYDEDVTVIVTVSGSPSVTGASPLGVAPAGDAADPSLEVDAIFSGVAGAPNEARIHVDLQGEWHINKAFVNFTLVDAPGYTLGEATLPAGHKSGDPAAGTEREDYTTDLDFSVPVSGPPGPAVLKIEVGYQACKGASLCKLPDVRVVSVPVEIGTSGAALSADGGAGVSADGGAGVSNGGSASGGFAAAKEQGLLALVLLCFAAGVGVSFTPCVLPMVPITMGLIGAKGAGSRAQAVSLAGTYVLGLASVYTALGVFAGVTGSLFGSQLQSPWVVGSITVFFVGMGFSMFGFFDVQMPSAIMSRMTGKAGGGYVGAAVLGVIGAFLAGPCSGPIVASILALIGKEGQVWMGALLMFAFSLGIGMIFLVTGAASGWLPARGAWMVSVKKGFGIVLWLGAIFYAAPHLSTGVTAFATAGVLIVTAVFGWPSAEDGEGPFLERLRQTYGVGAGLVGAYLLLGALVQGGFILPPVSLGALGASSPAGPSIAWGRSESEAVAQARAEGKLLMIDFTAEWCQACHELEKYTYTDPTVIAAAKDFVPVMVDCTEKGDEGVLALQRKYGVSGLPTVLFVTPEGRIVGETVVGFLDAPEFLTRMKAALEARG